MTHPDSTPQNSTGQGEPTVPEKCRSAGADDMISRKAVLDLIFAKAKECDDKGDYVSKLQGATAAVICNAILELPAAPQSDMGIPISERDHSVEANKMVPTCTNCGADMSIIRSAACCSDTHEDAALNALADARAGGPFVPVSLDDLTAPQEAEPVAWDALAEFKSSAEFARKAYSHVLGDINGRTASVGMHEAVNHEHLRRIYAEAKETFPRFADTLAWLLWHDILRFDRLAMLVEEHGLRVPAPSPAAPVDEDTYRYAVRLASFLREQHYPEAKDWSPLNTTLGVLTQIDNMVAGLSRTQPAPQVKALEWEPVDDEICTKWRADALGGQYQLVAFEGEDGFAVNFHWGRPLSFWFIQGEPDSFGPTGPKIFESLDAAKAAAQADYERRILSALSGEAQR